MLGVFTWGWPFMGPIQLFRSSAITSRMFGLAGSEASAAGRKPADANTAAATRLFDALPDSSVATRVERYERRRLPVYALLQDDGTARLYAGAFKEPTEAEPLYEALRAAGIQTTLVYRTGRVY